MLHLENISKAYGERTLFSSFSLKLKKGEKVLVQGVSGSGKSTLLKMILGFEKPDTGRILIGGELLDGHSVWRLRREVAYVPQEPELEEGVGDDLLRRSLEYAANSELMGNLKQVPGLMADFGLNADVLKQDAGSLSGGEKQRLMMISAIVLGRPLILLDEPSSALDPDACRKTIKFFKNHPDLSMLAVSHDREWEGLADRVIVLREDR